jgi:hypothetical protein
MSIKRAKHILIVFIIAEIGLSISSLFSKDLGLLLFGLGSVLMFTLMYIHPDTLLVTKLSELDDQTRQFSKIDHLMLWCAIGIGALGVFIKADL